MTTDDRVQRKKGHSQAAYNANTRERAPLRCTLRKARKLLSNELFNML